MAASFPSSAKSFTTKASGNTVEASHMNDAQDEITAIENCLLGNTSLTPSFPGVAFPASQSASSGANTLDDYEEGSWTPVLGGSGGESGQAYTLQVGSYVKVGQLVIATFNVQLSTKGTITGTAQISGLPFNTTATANANGGSAVGFFGNMGTNVQWVGLLVDPNTSAVRLTVTTAAATSATLATTSEIADTTQIIGTIMYRAAA